MAVNVTLATVSSGYNLSDINANFAAIETALADCVSRSGGTPNTLTADLDANSNTITNLPTPSNNTDAASKKYVDDNIATGAANAAAAAASATAAAASETAAASSAGAASTSESNAATSESNAATSETNAASSASAASSSATASASSATSASGSATAASASETAAAASETAAASSETNAASSASSAASSATAAATSETNAAASESAAATSETNAAASYDSFDDRYLGPKASDPSVDNDGDPLSSGVLYYNTTSGEMMVYNGSAWVAAYVSASGALLASNNLTDLVNAATARTNLGVAIGTDVQAHSTVLDNTTASYTSAEETKLSGIETGATADQTGAEIKTAYEAEANTNAYTDAEKAKLAGVETAADVTDETNVTSALSGATLTAVTVATDDKVIVQDTSDSSNIKTVTAQSIADLAGGGAENWSEDFVTAKSTISSTIPHDDTVPTSSEGTEIASIASVSPAASQQVEIEYEVSWFGNDNTGIAVLFRDTTAIDVMVMDSYAASDAAFKHCGKFIDTPGAGTYTYSVRVGTISGTGYLNSYNTSTRGFGGKLKSGLRLRLI